MNPARGDKESTWDYVRSAMIVFSYLVRKAEDEKKDLLAEVEKEIQSHDKRILEAATHQLLDDLRIELLVPKIVSAVAQKFNETLQEARWTKWLLFISQAFGVAGAFMLSTNYEKLPPGSLVYLIPYGLGAIVGVFVLVMWGRQKIG